MIWAFGDFHVQLLEQPRVDVADCDEYLTIECGEIPDCEPPAAYVDRAEDHDLIMEGIAAALENIEPYKVKADVPKSAGKGKKFVSVKWVFDWRWDVVSRSWYIKARLVVRGFKDKQGDSIETAASTASRWGQRTRNRASRSGNIQFLSKSVKNWLLGSMRVHRCPYCRVL